MKRKLLQKCIDKNSDRVILKVINSVLLFSQLAQLAGHLPRSLEKNGLWIEKSFCSNELIKYLTT